MRVKTKLEEHNSQRLQTEAPTSAGAMASLYWVELDPVIGEPRKTALLPVPELKNHSAPVPTEKINRELAKCLHFISCH